jgi:hypothetical protein
MVPNASVLQNIPTVNDCAEKCDKNQWCSTMTYDAKNKTCSQFVSQPENFESFQTFPATQQQVLLTKKPSDDVILNDKYKQIYAEPKKGTYIKGGVIMNGNISVHNINDCAAACGRDDRCDAFVYRHGNKTCDTHQTGFCDDPKDPTCGTIESPSDTPGSYATKKKEAIYNTEYKDVTNTNSSCSGMLYCGKNWDNKLPDDWNGAECVDSVAIYDDGTRVQIGNWGAAQPYTGNKNNKFKKMLHRCSKTGRGWMWKAKEGQYGYNNDCNLPPNVRYLNGAGSGTIDKGMCDCENYARKLEYGGKELKKLGAGDWKGAKVISATSNGKQIPTNRATSVGGNGSPIICQVSRDDNNPFIKGNGQCASNKTDYQCSIM